MHGSSLRRHGALSFVVLSLVFGSATFAQDRSATKTAVGQPTIVVSTSKVERLLQNVSYLMRTVGQPEMGGMVTLAVNQYSQGVDRSRPIGFAVTLNAVGNPTPVVMLPIADLKSFFAGLANFGEPEDLGN